MASIDHQAAVRKRREDSCFFGVIAQMEERYPCKVDVESSNLSDSTRNRVVAQLVAFLVWDQVVAGSSPVYSTKTFFRQQRNHSA